MKNVQFPVNFEFKITTFANDFVAKDANGQTIAYTRQKMFKFKEDIEVFNNESKEQRNYRIKADRWLDFSAAYSFFDASEKEIGKVVRKGWKSLWKAEYEIIDAAQQSQYVIKEENAWIRVLDGVVAGIPILNWFTGYIFNPAYLVIDKQGQTVFRLKKKASFFGRSFALTKLNQSTADNERVLLGVMMMLLLERRRG